MNRQVIKNRIRKVFAYTLTSIVFLLISSFLTLQIPVVQENIISRYLRTFSKVTGFKSTVKNFRLLWFDRLELEDVKILDTDSNRMIAAKKILINFRLSQLISRQDINIDELFVDNGEVLLTNVIENDSARLNINVFVDRINHYYASQNYDSTQTGRTPRINIGKAHIVNSRFSYVDQYKDSIPSGFNYNQFIVDVDGGQLQDFLILGDTLQFQVNSLLATDRQSRLQIRELTTFFRISQQAMEFSNMKLKANESLISDSVIFTYNGMEELGSSFNQKVRIHANLVNSVIEPKDLALFAPFVEKIKQPVRVNGIVHGTVSDFTVKKMEVESGNTLLKGSLDMEGLPDINETFIILDLKNSKLAFDDLDFAISENYLSQLRPIGRVSMDGQFLGYPNDFVAKGNFAGNLGNISSDINFKVHEEDFNRSDYSGTLELIDFDLGRYLRDTLNFQKVSLKGKVKGSGLTMSTADFTLNGKVSAIGIRNYDYTRIETNARFASQLFKGFISIDDPNLQLTANGTIDLREGFNTIKILGRIDTAYLDNLKLTSRPIFIHSSLDIDTKGLELDSLVGKADLQNFTIHYNDKHLSLPNIRIESTRDNRNRSVQLQSTLVDAEVHGDFLLSDISRDAQKLVKEILLNIKNDQQAISHYYKTENYRPKSYESAFSVRIKNVAPLVELTNTNFLLSRHTVIEGKFTSGYTSILQAYATIDSLSYDQNLMLDTDLELTASKIADSTSVLAMAFVHSEKQYLGKNLQTKNLVTEAIWNKNHIDFGLDADQEASTNAVRLKGEVDFLKDSTQIKLLPSTLQLLEKQWHVDPANLITLQGKTVHVRNLKIGHQDQFILCEGAVSEDPSEKLALKVFNLDLNILNPLTGRAITGRLEALFELTNYYYNPYIQNDLTIDSLTINHFLIGNITGKNQWDTLENKFLINFFIDRNAKRIVNVEGFYNPSRETNRLDVTAQLEKANLKIVEPFFDDFFSNLGGTISGRYRISGNLEAPSFEGEGQVDNGQIMINYLKTLYHFTGVIGLSPNSVYFKDIELQDLFNNKGQLNGTITHQAFQSARLNLDARFKNFQVLNTSPKDNSLFYGQGYATGDLNIFGPVSNLKFTANARTDKNTRIFIPIGGTSEIEKKEFIKFVSFSDSTFQKSLTDKVSTKLDLSGITLDFNLDVTPDAYCQIILDLKAGDIIYGRGNGDLQLQLDTKGDFTMFGPFEFTEGKYNFTLYDIINKDFEIKKGSRITWYGDPYAGVLDLTATYNQLASFAPIISNQEFRDSPQLRRKYPVDVVLKLEGPMLASQFNFDIVAGELPQSIIVNDEHGNQTTVRLDFDFQAFKNKMDEQELKRQVFSLIVLRRFSPPESFNTSGSIVTSLSEFLSNQLSNWVSQVDENLEVDVDLNTLDTESFNTFQLRLSYTFFNGRLRITRDGTFYSNSQSNSTVSNSQANLSSLAGDWTVDYLLTADGKLKVKMYNRTNINPILSTLGAANSVTTGVSLTHTQSFNELKDLLKRTREKKKQPAPDPNTSNKEALKKDEDGE